MRKLKKLCLLTLTSFSIVSMTGCKHDNKEEERQQEAEPSGEKEQEIEGIKTYSKTPMTSLSDSNKQKIQEFFILLDDEDLELNTIYEVIETATVGYYSNEVVEALLDLLLEIRHWVNDDKFGNILDFFNDKKFKDFGYELLAIFNAIDVDTVETIMGKLINKIADKERKNIVKKGYHGRACEISNAYKADVNYFTPQKLEFLKTHKDEFNDAEFNTILSNIENYIGDFVYSKTITDYVDNYKAEILTEYNEGPLFVFIKDAIKSYGKIVKNGGILFAKAIIDNISWSDIVEIIGIFTNNVEFTILPEMVEEGEDENKKQYALMAMPNMMLGYAHYIAKHKGKVINILKSLSGNVDFLSALLSIGAGILDLVEELSTFSIKKAVKVEVPDAIKDKIKKLSGDHLSAVLNLLIKIIEKIDETKLLYMINNVNEDNLYLFAQEYIPLFLNIMSEIDGKDKTNIINAFAVFGVDFEDILYRLKRMDEFTDYTTAEGQQSVMAKLMTLGQELMMVFGINLGMAEEEEEEPEEEPENEEEKPDVSRIEVHSQKAITAGTTINEYSLDFDVVFKGYPYSLTLPEIKTKVEDFEYTFEETVAAKPGFYDVKYTYTLYGTKYEGMYTFYVNPKESMNIDNDYKYDENVKGSDYSKTYYVQKDEDIAKIGKYPEIDTTRHGYHVAHIEDHGLTDFIVYYVYDESEIYTESSTFGELFAFKDEKSNFIGSYILGNYNEINKDYSNYKYLYHIQAYQLDDLNLSKEEARKDFAAVKVAGFKEDQMIPYTIVDPEACETVSIEVDYKDIIDNIVNKNIRTFKTKGLRKVVHQYLDEDNEKDEAYYQFEDKTDIVIYHGNYNEEYNFIEFDFENRHYVFSLDKMELKE